MIGLREIGLDLDGHAVLNGVDLELDPGEGLCLSGADGSGRSALLEIAATVRRPSRGSVSIRGIDAVRLPHRARALIAHAGPESGLHPELTVGEHLELIAASRGQTGNRRRHSVEAALELSEIAGRRRSATLSHGQLARLALAAALAAEPALLLVDSLLDRLDPAGRARYCQRLARFRAQGGTLMISTQWPRALGEVCSHVAILDRGRLVGYHDFSAFSEATAGALAQLAPEMPIDRDTL